MVEATAELFVGGYMYTATLRYRCQGRQHEWTCHPPGGPAPVETLPGPSWRARQRRSWPGA